MKELTERGFIAAISMQAYQCRNLTPEDLSNILIDLGFDRHKCADIMLELMKEITTNPQMVNYNGVDYLNNLQ